jgi:phospholipid/cholesterol/gamma-HCH transport system permease protein
MAAGQSEKQPRLDVESSDPRTVLRFTGPLDVAGMATLWTAALQASRTARGRELAIDLTGVTVCDTAGATLLLACERAHGGPVNVSGAQDRVTAVIDLVRPVAGPPVRRPAGPGPGWREVILSAMSACGGGIAYIGEIAVALVRLPTRLRMFRMGDFIRTADQAGVQAIPLALLLGVLIGLILAFQSLVPMRRFGADIYVANLVSLGLLRELGPLLTAVVLSGRSGSAFAAEIGTMKVNQELDAMATMGIDAVTMLVLPRLLAAVLIMPVLTVVMELAGLLGMTLVLVASGIPPVAVGNQVPMRWCRSMFMAACSRRPCSAPPSPPSAAGRG